MIVTEGRISTSSERACPWTTGRSPRIDSLVTDKGDWLFNANAYLKYSKAEDWERAAEGRARVDAGADQGGQRLPRSVLRQASSRRLGACLARGLKAARTRIASNDPNPTCKVGIPPGVLYIVNRDYVVDEEMGVVNIYCRFGNSPRACRTRTCSVS